MHVSHVPGPQPAGRTLPAMAGGSTSLDDRPGFQPLPLDLVDGLGELPFDVHVRRGSRMVLYARRGAEARSVFARARGGLELHIPLRDAAALRAVLLETLEARTPRGARSAEVAAGEFLATGSCILEPLFTSPRSHVTAGLDPDAVRTAQRVADGIVRAVEGDPAMGCALLLSVSGRGEPTTARALARRGLHTAAVATVLASRSGAIDPATTVDLARAGVLHDVAMPLVASVALGKPGPLEATEWTATHRHPLAGVGLVRDALGSEPSFGSLIAQHHERADGSGYPRRLQGDRLSLPARIIGLADAFDAITSPRAHKPAYPATDALRILVGAARGRFDRDLLLLLAGAIAVGAGPESAGWSH